MWTITYNDLQFSLEQRGHAWTVLRALPDGSRAVVGAGLFEGAAEEAAAARAAALVRTLYPAGVRSVGPDVAHPNRIGDLRIVGPDVRHPNFIYWTKDSTSCPQWP